MNYIKLKNLRLQELENLRLQPNSKSSREELFFPENLVQLSTFFVQLGTFLVQFGKIWQN